MTKVYNKMDFREANYRRKLADRIIPRNICDHRGDKVVSGNFILCTKCNRVIGVNKARKR